MCHIIFFCHFQFRRSFYWFHNLLIIRMNKKILLLLFRVLVLDSSHHECFSFLLQLHKLITSVAIIWRFYALLVDSILNIISVPLE